jgi:UDP-N-acetylmuramoyl-tripeptide--D-alanyl-D-alanine ligase
MYAIIDDEKYAIDERTVLVKNGLEFLQKLANYHRKKFNIPVIGITGSNGKTSTKELINAVLSTTYNVLATRGNLNNHIGVPLTLLNLNQNHEIAIIEMGANKFNDIEELSTFAEPTHGIITNIGKAHLEGFGGFEGVLKTKKELYEAISKVKGTIVYNHDDTILTNNLPQHVTLFTYGTTASSNILGTLTELNPFVTFQWRHETYESPKIITKMIGKYNFYNYLAAISFGKLFNVQNQQINEALTSYEPVNNRSQVYKTANNTLILDCYNANPTLSLIHI